MKTMEKQSQRKKISLYQGKSKKSDPVDVMIEVQGIIKQEGLDWFNIMLFKEEHHTGINIVHYV